MVRYVVDALRAAGIERMVVVVGYRAELVRQELAGEPGNHLCRADRAAGHGPCRDDVPRAARQARRSGFDPGGRFADGASFVAACGAERFVAERPACLLGTATKPDPTGLGRIVRDAAGEFLAIVEEKDATPAEQAITEVNMSTYVFQAADLLWALDQLNADNAQRRVLPDGLPGCPEGGGQTSRRRERAAAV